MTYVIHLSKKEHDVGFTLQSEIQFIPWYVLLRSSDCNKLRSLHLMSSFITLIYHSLSTSTFIQNWSLLQQNTPNKSKPFKTHTHVNRLNIKSQTRDHLVLVHFQGAAEHGLCNVWWKTQGTKSPATIC